MIATPHGSPADIEPRVLPRRHPDLEVADFPTELVIYDHRVHQVHHLTGLDALTFDACDGHTTRTALIDELMAGTTESPQDLGRAVDAVLAALADRGLLEGTAPSAPPPCVGCGERSSPRRRRPPWSRRDGG